MAWPGLGKPRIYRIEVRPSTRVGPKGCVAILLDRSLLGTRFGQIHFFDIFLSNN